MDSYVKRWQLLLTAALVFVVSGIGFAFASIPDSDGVIHGCYRASNGLRLIDTGLGQTCKPNETAVNWNRTGPAGEPGSSAIAVLTGESRSSLGFNPGTTDPISIQGATLMVEVPTDWTEALLDLRFQTPRLWTTMANRNVYIQIVVDGTPGKPNDFDSYIFAPDQAAGQQSMEQFTVVGPGTHAVTVRVKPVVPASGGALWYGPWILVVERSRLS